MTGDGPPQLLFDPKSGAVPDQVGPGASPDSAGGGVVTLFLAKEADREWAGRTAIELARTWGDSGQRVFLGDVCFHAPTLHELLDEPPSPNLADVILRQVRIEEVVRSVVAGSFLFAPACPAGDKSPPVLGDVGWEGLIAGFAEVGATVFFFADEHVPGLGHILEASSTVFALGSSGSVDLPPEVATRVSVVLRPPAGAQAHLAPDPAVDESVAAGTDPEIVAPWSEGLEELVVEEPALVESAPGDPGLPEGDGLPDPGVPDPSFEADQAAFGSFDQDPPEPLPPGEVAPPREWEAYLEEDGDDMGADGGGDIRSGPTTWVRRSLLGIMVISVGLLLIWIAWPDHEASQPAVENELPPATAAATPSGDEPESKDASEEPTPAPAQPEASDEAVPTDVLAASNEDLALEYSLTLASYRDPAAALRRAEALGRLLPGERFIVAPVQVGGTGYHRLLAVAAGADEARALRSSIAAGMGGADGSSWIVRRTPLAFELAAVSDLEEARTLVARAESQAIFAYIVVQSGTGRPVYSVLAGAYRAEDEAAAMGDLLAKAGFADAGLKSRVGRMVR